MQNDTTTPAQCPVVHSETRTPVSAATSVPTAKASKAYWQYPLPTGSVAERYVSGPLKDGSGDQDALVELDPRFTPWAPPLVMKQLPLTLAGTVQGQMLTYPHARVLVWLTLHPEDDRDLGGTVTVYIGEEMEAHSFDVPTLLYIPANTPHGVVVYGKDMKCPIMHVDTFPELAKGEPQRRPDLDARLPDFTTGFPDKRNNPAGGVPGWNPAGGGLYGQYLFTGQNPNPDFVLPPASQVTVVPGDIPGLPLEKGFQFLSNFDPMALNGIPMHITHAHPCSENLVFYSSDPDQPHDLGGMVRIYAFDTEIKKLVPVDMTKPFASASARGKHLHCPMVRRDMTRKIGFIWYTTDFDPRVFEEMGAKGAVAMQLHNEHYTEGRFNMAEYGVLPEDLPEEPEGDGGFLSVLEPHLNWTIARGHNGIYAPKLKIPRKIRVKQEEPLLPPATAAAGTWACEAVMPLPMGAPEPESGGDPVADLVLRIEGNTLTGDYMSDGEVMLSITDGRISGNELSWRYVVPLELPMPMKVEVRLEGDRLVGTYGLVGVRKWPFNAVRKP